MGKDRGHEKGSVFFCCLFFSGVQGEEDIEQTLTHPGENIMLQWVLESEGKSGLEMKVGESSVYRSSLTSFPSPYSKAVNHNA